MKKTMTIALSLIMAATMLAGCRRPMDDGVPSEPTKNTMTTAPAATTKPTTAPTTAPTTRPTSRPTDPTTMPTDPTTDTNETTSGTNSTESTATKPRLRPRR